MTAHPGTETEAGGLPTISPKGSLIELRGSERTSLSLIRSAKILFQTGEYICLVRDVSTTGIKLRLFHPLPEEDHALLELGNGDVYAMTRVWQQGNLGGFRFAAPIDLKEFLEEPSTYARRLLRVRLRRPALAHVGGASHQVLVRDLSQNGLCFESDQYLALCQPLYLTLGGMPEVGGWVRWRRGRDYGVVFDHDFRLDELANFALRLQPFNSDPSGGPQAASTVARCA